MTPPTGAGTASVALHVTATELGGAVIELHALPLGGEMVHAGTAASWTSSVAASWGGGIVASLWSSPMGIASWPPELPPEPPPELASPPVPPSCGSSRIVGAAPEQATTIRAVAPRNAPRILSSIAPGHGLWRHAERRRRGEHERDPHAVGQHQVHELEPYRCEQRDIEQSRRDLRHD